MARHPRGLSRARHFPGRTATPQRNASLSEAPSSPVPATSHGPQPTAAQLETPMKMGAALDHFLLKVTPAMAIAAAARTTLRGFIDWDRHSTGKCAASGGRESRDADSRWRSTRGSGCR